MQHAISTVCLQIIVEELTNFESFLNNIVSEESDLLDTEGEGQSQAIQQLNQLIGQELPAGVDGTNAIQSLKGLIDSPELEDAIKNIGKVIQRFGSS